MQSRAGRGQNASRWLLQGCQEAGVCWAVQPTWHAARPQERWPPSSEHLSFPSLHRECAIFFHPMLLPPAWFHFVFSNGGCPLLSSQYLQDTGGQDGLVRNIPLLGMLLPESQVSVSSQCCDPVTNTQALDDCMHHTLCLRVSDIASVMALIMPLRVSRLNYGLQAECTYWELSIHISNVGSLV